MPACVQGLAEGLRTEDFHLYFRTSTAAECFPQLNQRNLNKAEGPKSHPRMPSTAPAQLPKSQLLQRGVCRKRNRLRVKCEMRNQCLCVWSSEIKLTDLVFCHQFTPYSTKWNISYTAPWQKKEPNSREAAAIDTWLGHAPSPAEDKTFFRWLVTGGRERNEVGGTSSKNYADGINF